MEIILKFLNLIKSKNKFANLSIFILIVLIIVSAYLITNLLDIDPFIYFQF
jgi:hypothetical protein